MIHWFGDNRNGDKHWYFTCNSFSELYEQMLNGGLIYSEGPHTLGAFEEDLGYLVGAFRDEDWYEFLSKQTQIAHFQYYEDDSHNHIRFDSRGRMVQMR